MDTQQQTPPDDHVVSQQNSPVPPVNNQMNTASSDQSAQTADDTQQVRPVSVPTISREGEPLAVVKSEAGIAASVPEMEISPEMQKETGAEAVRDTPQLTPADTQVGIQHAKESVPVSAQPTASITLPMTQQQAQQTVKVHKKVKDSLFWFAMLIMRQWQIAQKKK